MPREGEGNYFSRLQHRDSERHARESAVATALAARLGDAAIVRTPFGSGLVLHHEGRTYYVILQEAGDHA